MLKNKIKDIARKLIENGYYVSVTDFYVVGKKQFYTHDKWRVIPITTLNSLDGWYGIDKNGTIHRFGTIVANGATRRVHDEYTLETVDSYILDATITYLIYYATKYEQLIREFSSPTKEIIALLWSHTIDEIYDILKTAPLYRYRTKHKFRSRR